MSDLRTLLSSAYDSAKQGYYRDALADFRAILEHNNRNVDALYGAAACSFRLEQSGECLAYLDRILRLQPGHPGAKRLLEEARRKEIELAIEPTREEPFHYPELPHDAFGTGAGDGEIKEVSGWVMEFPEPPTFPGLVKSGEDIRTGQLRIGLAYRLAWGTYRSQRRRLYFAGLLSLLIQVGVNCFLLTFLAPLFISGFGRPWFFLLVVFPFATPVASIGLSLFSMSALYAHAVLREGRVPFQRMALAYLEQWVRLAAANFYAFGPLMGGLFASFLLELRDHFGPGSLTRGPLFYATLVVLASQVFLLWRCWFVNLVAGLEKDVHPLSAVSKAYYGTRGQSYRVLLFAVLQCLFLPFCLISLGYWYPVLNLAQAEAYRQIYESGEK
jgi:tetratricopeptide (TPR) repeat protein